MPLNNLPFTTDQFLQVFEHYNVAVWPAQLVLLVIGLLAIYLAVQRKSDSSRFISLILALLWIWMGAIYHYSFFSVINRAAFVFAALFILQGAIFFTAGVVKNKLRFRLQRDVYGIAGGVLLAYALIVYPALGYCFGHRYPAAPTFGLPCPTTIFTFGMLLWTTRNVAVYVLLIPLVWSFIGFSAAISLGMTEDFGLLVAGAIGSVLLLLRSYLATNSRQAPRCGVIS